MGLTASRAARKFIIGGNWKANGTPESMSRLVRELNEGKLDLAAPEDVEVVCFPPFVYLSQVQRELRSEFQVGAQDLWPQPPGAWTGEIPAMMLADMGVRWAIVGHSERRELGRSGGRSWGCGETSDDVAVKARCAVDNGLRAMVCVGERLEAREAGTTFEVLDVQMGPLAGALAEADWERVVLAYEPAWAMGTGKVATPEQAEEVHAFLRQWLRDRVSEKAGDAVRIQYGGPVNQFNSKELCSKPNIDGFLVGGASLKARAFLSIINSVKEVLQPCGS